MEDKLWWLLGYEVLQVYTNSLQHFNTTNTVQAASIGLNALRGFSFQWAVPFYFKWIDEIFLPLRFSSLYYNRAFAITQWHFNILINEKPFSVF
jgi:hypothetical protein